MDTELAGCLNAIDFAEPQVRGDLTILPILLDAAEAPPLLTLAEGLAEGLATVREIAGQEAVAELEVSNLGDLQLLILDGEQVRGGLQDRTAAATVLLGPHSGGRIPVSCVEHGRWHGESGDFGSSDDLLLPRQRAQRHEELRGLPSLGDRRGVGQSAIWESIAEAQAQAGVTSSTGALRDLYCSLAPRIGNATGDFPRVGGQRGLVALLGDAVICLEVLGSEDAYGRYHARLVRSVLADALTRATATGAAPEPLGAARSFLAKALGCSETVVSAVGLGHEHYLSNGSVAGFALTAGAALVHLSLFSTDPDRPGRRAPTGDVAVPYARSYWVEAGRLLAGCYPGAKDLAEATAKLEALLDAGVRSVVSLMEPDEVGHGGVPFRSYDALLWKLARARGIEVALHRVPIRDQSTPSDHQMRRVLDTIDAGMAAGDTVYVHCWGGRGRTGTVVGCWLARHGKARGSEALKRVQWLRRLDPTTHLASPENEQQRAMVRGWSAGA